MPKSERGKNKFGDTYKTISPNPADRFVSDACFMTLESSLKTKRLCVFTDTPGSGYLFSCFITGLHWYKIGHEKQINKVLLTVRRYTALMQFWHGGHNREINRIITF